MASDLVGPVIIIQRTTSGRLWMAQAQAEEGVTVGVCNGRTPAEALAKLQEFAATFPTLNAPYPQAALAAAIGATTDREKVAAWMVFHEFATGHGDTLDDLLAELAWQTVQRADRVAALIAERDGLREKYALIAENWKSPLKPGSVDRLNGHKEAARWIAKAIREEN